jgi:hypothetical protein
MKKFFKPYVWKNIFEKPRDLYLSIKWFIQRGKRGFADYDVWYFDIYLSRVIKKGISQLKERKQGVPGELTQKEWDSILNDIIYAFTEEENALGKNPYNNFDERKEKGWKLFKEHFHDLWD